ncbi:DUF1289 domain-containing protein [Falsiroseomonas oryziterrae]|uniref:DUF1289 domain-containing protein n=1 Tax=Falsiroseomonas oryziterrae TaxID=2911368 RepID=UPI001F367732|nr:DUF1289 domain-containing protein [Roseomonas sp. NPKOSM-4]
MTIRSPCVKLCVLDARNVCEGCGRTLDEIAAWPAADEATRRAILATAAERRGRKEGAA